MRPSTIAISADFVKPRALTHGLLDVVPGIRHGFFTREGGVSGGIYASLNCGVGSSDDRALVFKNRARAMATLGVAPGRLATPYQVHGTNAVIVDTVWPTGQGPKADAVVTNRRGIAVGIGTADCGPVLFADAEAHVVGAAHAGWRGSARRHSRIGDRRDGADSVRDAARHRRRARPDDLATELRGRPRPDRGLHGGGSDNAPLLRAERTRRATPCSTFPATSSRACSPPGSPPTTSALHLCRQERFYSYRRATHLSEPDYGRLLSAIALPNRFPALQPCAPGGA